MAEHLKLEYQASWYSLSDAEKLSCKIELVYDIFYTWDYNVNTFKLLSDNRIDNLFTILDAVNYVIKNSVKDGLK